MTIYKLRIHTRDVSLTEDGLGDIARHTGYDLIERDSSGNIVSIISIDLLKKNDN